MLKLGLSGANLTNASVSKFSSSFKWHAKEKCKKKQKCKSVGKMTWKYEHAKKKHH